MVPDNHHRDEQVADLPAWAWDAFTDRQRAELPLRALWKLALRMYRPAQSRSWPTVQHVALVLESYLGSVTLDGRPSHRRLAEDTGRRPSTVRAALEELEQLGWVEIDRGQRTQRGYPAPHRYTATFPTDLAVTTGAHGPRLTVGPAEAPPMGLGQASSVGLREAPPFTSSRPTSMGLGQAPSMGPAEASDGASPGTPVGPGEAPEVATRSSSEKLPLNMPPPSLRSMEAHTTNGTRVKDDPTSVHARGSALAREAAS